MSLKLYEENDVQRLADAIRTKNGKTDKYKLSEMPEAVENITTGEYNIEQVIDGDECELVITTTLNVGDLTINLPDDFANASYLYWIKVTNDKYLISANITNIGVWEYSKNSNTITQIYTEGHNWQYFQVIGNNCLICRGGGSQGILLYEEETKSITQIYSSGIYLSNFKLFGNKCFIMSTNSAYPGILLYEEETKSITQIYSSGIYWNYYLPVGDNYIISENYSNKEGGVLLYDDTTKTITKKYDKGYFYHTIKKVGDNYLIGAGTSNTGVLLYNPTDLTITQLYDETTGYWMLFSVVGDNCLISSSSSASAFAGVLLYDNQTQTITKIYDAGYYWKSSEEINNKYLIGSYASKGLLLYDNDTKTIEQIYSTGHCEYFQVIGSKCLIYNDPGILVYNSEDNTVSKKYSNGYALSIFKVFNGKCLISGTNSSGSGIILYEFENDTFTLLNRLGYNYDTYIQDTGNNYYIESSDKTKSPYKLYYNDTDKTVKLVGLIVEA